MPPGSGDVTQQAIGVLTSGRFADALDFSKEDPRVLDRYTLRSTSGQPNFPRMRHVLPIVDHGLPTLISDLEERGRLDDVTIVAWGEFGRTPRIDPKTGGRHHWPQVGPAILAGGGMRGGVVIGETDRTASTAIARPVT